jgi:uncharacterized membrane protein
MARQKRRIGSRRLLICCKSSDSGPFKKTGTTINDRGLITGTGEGFNLFLYQNRELSDLSATIGQPLSAVREVNNRGVIVGNILRSDGPQPFPIHARAFVYQDGQFRLLEPLPGGIYTDAGGINNRAEVAGQSSLRLPDGSIVGHAVIWDAAGVRNLGTLPGTTHSLCTGINDRGNATGYADSHGFIYGNGNMRPLGNLSGHFYNAPRDINDRGDIVGESLDSNFGERLAFLCSESTLYDLNDLIPADSGWLLVCADGINDHGYITGTGIFGDRLHAFILEPVRPRTRQ